MKESFSKFKTIWLLVILILAGLISHYISDVTPGVDYGGASSNFLQKTENGSIKNSAENSATTLYFVGDIMMDRAVRDSVNRNGAGNYNFLFQKVGFLKEANLAFANLEGSVSDRGQNVGSIYSFRMDPMSLEALRNAGFDIVGVANNHAGDWTVEAFKDTLTHLTENGIFYTGGGENYNEASQVRILERNGIKIGFLAFSDVGPNWLKAGSSTPGIMIASDPNFTNVIKDASKQVDILVVDMNFGEEYLPYSNARQKYLAHLAIDSGARLIIGAHPHVIEETEQYKNGFIAYSLGNFIFDQNFSPETMEGGVLKAIVTKEGIATTTMEKVRLNSHFVPMLE